MITVTDKALAFFKKLLEKSNKTEGGLEKTPKNLGIRIGIKAGGCLGLQYFFEPVSNHDRFDHLMVFHGIPFFIDQKSMQIMERTVIDCEVVNLTDKIIFNNPQVKGSCGCADSFELKN